MGRQGTYIVRLQVEPEAANPVSNLLAGAYATVWVVAQSPEHARAEADLRGKLWRTRETLSLEQTDAAECADHALAQAHFEQAQRFGVAVFFSGYEPSRH